MNGRPQIVVVAGPNGAGKSTAAPHLLSGALRIPDFVNADVIAQGLSAFSPQLAAMAAGRIMRQRLRELANAKRHFGFETTLASRTYAPWIRELQRDGYQFRLLFLWLPSAGMAIHRVQQRVRTGGHDIDRKTIIRRYSAGLHNFFDLYRPIADSWRMYNNSTSGPPSVIASGRRCESTHVVDEVVWSTLTEEYDHD